MSAREAKCFSSAASMMKQPPAYFGSAVFSQLRWTLAGDQRDERMRLFCRKLLRRLDGMDMPFYPAVGLMSHKTARERYVTGVDPWTPAENPFLDGEAIEFRHCVADTLCERCWWLFAEVAFDVARLSQIPILWGGWADVKRPGMFRVYTGVMPSGWHMDKRTYGSRSKQELRWGDF